MLVKVVLRVWKRDRSINELGPLQAVEALRHSAPKQFRRKRYEVLSDLERGEVLETPLAWFVAQQHVAKVLSKKVEVCHS